MAREPRWWARVRYDLHRTYEMGAEMAWFWLKAVPWGTIIANAPQLVDSARKIIERRNFAQRPDGDPVSADPVSLARRVAALEARQQQIAELVESLAKSNEQLIRALQVLRIRAVWATRFAILLAIIVTALAAWVAFSR